MHIPLRGTLRVGQDKSQVVPKPSHLIYSRGYDQVHSDGTGWDSKYYVYIHPPAPEIICASVMEGAYADGGMKPMSIRILVRTCMFVWRSLQTSDKLLLAVF